MICVSQDIQLTESYSFTASGIEALYISLILPNKSTLQIDYCTGHLMYH